jgi:hypothetical protein
MKKEKKVKKMVQQEYFRDARLSPTKYMFNFALWKVT